MLTAYDILNYCSHSFGSSLRAHVIGLISTPESIVLLLVWFLLLLLLLQFLCQVSSCRLKLLHQLFLTSKLSSASKHSLGERRREKNKESIKSAFEVKVSLHKKGFFKIV